MAAIETFTGFSRRAVEFYGALEDDNTKPFWTAHKAVYEAEVAAPMRALLAELEPEFGAGRMFRPYRDVRFSADKTPYKTVQGALVGADSGIGRYLQLSADGLMVGGGFHAHTSSQTAQFRAAIDDPDAGSELESLVAALRADDFRIEGARLATRPRGFGADHPRIELLKYKELMAIKQFGAPDWLDSHQAVDEVAAGWRAVQPLCNWVERSIDAATPDRRRAR